MDKKGISILTTSAVILLLFRCMLMTEGRTSMGYQFLFLQTKTALDVTETAYRTIKANQTAVEALRGGFGVSECWNYTLDEDERLADNYGRLNIFKRYAKDLNITIDVIVSLGNVQRAIKHKRKSLGLPRIQSTTTHVSNMNISKKNMDVIQAALLSNLEKNLFLMLNDFDLRSQKTA
ncbi:uncharacterized protein LOC114520521 [Dendronephthya gigantea]|uniref:uncharacterized protein LOC114520521 n=1 Tax=Dendronephthya gigantea TaxID=151771 RepID=UPI00106BF731|nr:uncharacterized protein LOC114520521 [Dendronephthya gigantea]